MGLFKKIAHLVIDRQVKKVADKLPPDQADKLRQSTDLVAQNFEDNVNSSAKVTMAFIAGISGGPVGAFGSAIGTAGSEANKNQAKFVNAALTLGIPVYVNGQQINPAVNQQPPSPKVISNMAIAMVATGFAFVAGTIIILSSSHKKDD